MYIENIYRFINVFLKTICDIDKLYNAKQNL